MSKQVNQHYQQRKDFFEGLMTIYGRKPVLEALQDKRLQFFKLHLADSNRREGIIRDIESLAERRGIPVEYHDRRALSRISRNGKQDQGVAADLELAEYRPVKELLAPSVPDPKTRLIALDGITNPQNLGMIIRSVCASGIDGLILPRKGCAALSPLVIKASAGSLFKTTIYHCQTLAPALEQLGQQGFTLCSLSSHAEDSLFTLEADTATVFVLGNETEGVSPEVMELCSRTLCIPMHNGVESLNVAVTAALIAFACKQPK